MSSVTPLVADLRGGTDDELDFASYSRQRVCRCVDSPASARTAWSWREVMGKRALRASIALAITAALISPGPVRAASTIAASRLASETLGPITPLSPQDFGAAGTNGLAYANP